MQSTQRDEDAFAAVGVGQCVGAPRIRDVHLDDDEVRAIVCVNAFDMLVDDHGLVIVTQVGSKSGEAERRKQRVLDGTPERTGCLRQRRQDHLDLHEAASPMSSTEMSRERGPSSSTRNTRCHRPN